MSSRLLEWMMKSWKKIKASILICMWICSLWIIWSLIFSSTMCCPLFYWSYMRQSLSGGRWVLWGGKKAHCDGISTRRGTALRQGSENSWVGQNSREAVAAGLIHQVPSKDGWVILISNTCSNESQDSINKYDDYYHRWFVRHFVVATTLLKSTVCNLLLMCFRLYAVMISRQRPPQHLYTAS